MDEKEGKNVSLFQRQTVKSVEKCAEKSGEKIENKCVEKHVVYLLFSPSTKRTYIGYTNNVENRLRCHNGEKCGGAKYTRWGRPWVMVGYVQGFPNKHDALKFEWRCHHPRKYLSKNVPNRPKNGRGREGKIRLFQSVMKMERVTLTATPNAEMNLKWILLG